MLAGPTNPLRASRPATPASAGYPMGNLKARPPHEPQPSLSCTPGLAGYPFDPIQLWHG